MAEIHVKVEPESDKFRVETGAIIKVRLESEAEKGRANAELLRRFEEILGERPGIVSGHRSRRKKLAIDMEENQIMEELEKHG